MALAGYFTMKPAHEKHEQPASQETDPSRTFFASLGMNEEQQKLALEEMAKDREQWKEITLQDPESTNHSSSKTALLSSMIIGLAYAAGGVISLLPYFIYAQPLQALKVSAIITLLLIFICSWIKNYGRNGFWNAFQQTLVGALAAAATFGVARIFWNG